MLTINEQIGKKIKELRIEKGLTQTEFANLFNLTQNAVTNIETGKRTLYYEELLSMANYFDVSTDYLIKENGVRDKNPEIQYICDYTGLNEQSVQRLHNWCNESLDDLIDSIDEDCIDDFLSSQREHKKIINDFILSSVCNTLLFSVENIKDVSKVFVSYLAFYFGDFDYFCRLQKISNLTINELYNFFNKYKETAIDLLEEKKDLSIFRFQKVMNNYLDEISILQRVNTENLNGFSRAFSKMNLCVYSSIKVGKELDRDIGYIQKVIKENRILRDEEITILKNVYEQFKKEV